MAPAVKLSGRTGWDWLTRYAGSPSSRPAVARFEPTRAGALALPRGKLLNGRGGIGSPLRGSPSSRPEVARFEPTRAGALALPRGKLLNGRGGIGSPATRVRRARSLRSLGSNPRGAGALALPRGKLLNGRGGIRTHEAGLLPTRSPGVRLSPLGHPSGSLRGEAGGREAEGVGFEPTRLFRVNALAGRRLKPLGHPSAGSCCPDWPARTRTWNLLVQSQTCCQFHHGPTSQ